MHYHTNVSMLAKAYAVPRCRDCQSGRYIKCFIVCGFPQSDVYWGVRVNIKSHLTCMERIDFASSWDGSLGVKEGIGDPVVVPPKSDLPPLRVSLPRVSLASFSKEV